MTVTNENVNMDLIGAFVTVTFLKEDCFMATVMTNLQVSQDKVQLLMAKNCMNPYDLCSKAGISYASYRRIMKLGGCKLATLGKIAAALKVEVTEILK